MKAIETIIRIANYLAPFFSIRFLIRGVRCSFRNCCRFLMFAALFYSCCINNVPLLAEQDDLVSQLKKGMTVNFFGGSHSTNSSPVGLIVFLLVIALFLIFIFFLDRNYRHSKNDAITNSNELFRELCRAHQLAMRERLLLVEIAEDASLENPLPLFVEPKYLLDTLQDFDLVSVHPLISTIIATLFGKEILELSSGKSRTSIQNMLETQAIDLNANHISD
ncbi:MAG: hypothetical protein ACRCUY_12110 [Thermoguttaceae bacterium]